MKKLIWTALLAMMLGVPTAQARGGGGGSHGGWSGGGSHGIWSGGNGGGSHSDGRSGHGDRYGGYYGGWGWWLGGYGDVYYYSPYYATPLRTYTTAIPVGCQPVVIDGVAYYTINGVTYMQTSYGYYQAVQPPRTLLTNTIVPATPSAASVSPPMTTVPMPATPPPPPQKAVTGQTAAKVPDVKEIAAPKADEDVTVTVGIPSAKGGEVSVILKKYGDGFLGPRGEFYPEFPKLELLRNLYGK